MAFQQFKFDQVTFQSRDIFNTYIYETDDTIADVLTTGYFDACRYAASPDWIGSIIQCKCSDGFVDIEVGEGGEANIVVRTSDAIYSAQTLADAVTMASRLRVGSVIQTVEYNTGTAIGGNTYQVLDAGSSGARPAADGGSVIHLTGGSGGLYLFGIFPPGNISVAQFGADNTVNDTDAIHAALNYGVATGMQVVALKEQKVTTITIPDGACFVGYGDAPNRFYSTFTQIAGQTGNVLECIGISHTTQNRRVYLDRLRATSLSTGTTGIHLENVGLSDFGTLEAQAVGKGFTIKQCQDCTGNFLHTRNTVDGGEIINSTEDNTNNMIFNFINCESFSNSGLAIIGSVAASTNSNNKCVVSRLKIESGSLSPTATFMLKVQIANQMHLGATDVVIIGNEPALGFVPVQFDRAYSLKFDSFEFRDQTNHIFAKVFDMVSCVGVEIPLSYYLTQPASSEIVSVNNANCSNIFVKLIRAISNSASTLSNISNNSSMAMLDSATFGNDFSLSTLGEGLFNITRRNISKTWTLGRIDGSGNFRIFNAGVLYLTFSAANGNFSLANGDFACSALGKGLLVYSPDGLVRKRIGIDNTGALLLTSV